MPARDPVDRQQMSAGILTAGCLEASGAVLAPAGLLELTNPVAGQPF